jgi:hypothetical protein
LSRATNDTNTNTTLTNVQTPPTYKITTPKNNNNKQTAYLGAANAGIPLSIIVKEYGWGAYFSTLVGACALALLLLSPMVNLRSYVQRKEQRRLRGQ